MCMSLHSARHILFTKMVIMYPFSSRGSQYNNKKLKLKTFPTPPPFFWIQSFSVPNKALFSLTGVYIFLTHSMCFSCMTDFLEIDSAHAGLFAISSICQAANR